MIKKLNPDPCQESILEEREIAMDLSATISDVADILTIMLRDWSKIEKSNQSPQPSEISEDMTDKDVNRSWKTIIISIIFP